MRNHPGKVKDDSESQVMHLLSVILLTAASIAVSLPAAAAAIEEPLECIIEPFQTVKIGSQAAGILAEVNVNRGDMVKKGQVVGRLRSNVEEATVELARARTKSRAKIRAAKAAVGFERRRRKRNRELYRKKVISNQNLDQVETELALREQELEIAQEEARIAALELKRSLAVLGIRTIRSSIDGVVIERALSPGEFVLNEGQVVTIAQIDPLNVEVFVPIALYPDIKVGMSAKVMPEAPIGGELEAVVSIVDRVFDAASGTFGVRLTLANPDSKIPAGLHCMVHFLQDE